MNFPLLRVWVPAALLATALALTGCPGGGEDGTSPAGRTSPRGNQTKQQEKQTQQRQTDEPTAETSRQGDSAEQEPAADEKEKSGQDSAEGRIEPIDREGLLKAIEGHRGDVVLVDFWATWCPPCIEAFPDLITLHRSHEDLVVISVNMDRGEEAMAEARAFLEEHDPPFRTYRLDVPEYSPFVRAMSDDWEGGLPAIFIYGRAGQRRHELLGRHGMDEIRSRAEPLLEEDPPGRKVPPPASREGN